MSEFYNNLIFAMLFVVLPIITIIQILLCKLKSGFPGLILPLLLLYPGFSFSAVFFAFPWLFMIPLVVFVLPEITLLTIYFYIRRKPKAPTSDELRNMRAQDL